MSYRNVIELEGLDLDVGDSKYMTCPSCSKPNKFSISRIDNGALLYHCFSNSCLLHRGGALGGTYDPTATKVPIKQRVVFDKELRKLTEVERLHLRSLLGWKAQHRVSALPHYCDEMDRYAFPILDPMGNKKGWVLRTWDGRTPKALTYLEVDGTRLSYYAGGTRYCKSVVVVEDIPSAVRAAEYHNAVSLQGTSCNTDDAFELAEHYDHVIWCLDDDAFKQGLRLQREHSFLFKQSDVICPRCDLKDMPEAELKELLGD
jgi:hypothetical protein